MAQHNTGVILLALLLAAMAMVPMVSAEKNMAGKIWSKVFNQSLVEIFRARSD